MESPSSVMSPFFANQSCDPFQPRDSPCDVGAYVRYTVNATEITFDQGVHVNLDLSKVFCQAYSDEDGVQPLGGPFKAPERLVICDVPVPLGSVLCYVGGERVKKD